MGMYGEITEVSLKDYAVRVQALRFRGSTVY